MLNQQMKRSKFQYSYFTLQACFKSKLIEIFYEDQMSFKIIKLVFVYILYCGI